MKPSKATEDAHTVIISTPPTSPPPPPTVRDETSPTTPTVNITSQISESQKKQEEESPPKIDSPPITASNDMTTTSSTTPEPTPSKSIIPSRPEHSEEQKTFNRQLHEEQQLDQTQPLVLEGRDSELRDQRLQDEEYQEGSESEDSMDMLMRSDYRPSASMHTGRLEGKDYRETELRKPPAQAEQDEQGVPRARVGITMRSATPTITQTKWTIEKTRDRIDVLEATTQQTNRAVQQILETLNIMNQKSLDVGPRSGHDQDVDAEISGTQFSDQNTYKPPNSHLASRKKGMGEVRSIESEKNVGKINKVYKHLERKDSTEPFTPEPVSSIGRENRRLEKSQPRTARNNIDQDNGQSQPYQQIPTRQNGQSRPSQQIPAGHTPTGRGTNNMVTPQEQKEMETRAYSQDNRNRKQSDHPIEQDMERSEEYDMRDTYAPQEIRHDYYSHSPTHRLREKGSRSLEMEIQQQEQSLEQLRRERGRYTLSSKQQQSLRPESNSGSSISSQDGLELVARNDASRNITQLYTVELPSMFKNTKKRLELEKDTCNHVPLTSTSVLKALQGLLTFIDRKKQLTIAAEIIDEMAQYIEMNYPGQNPHGTQWDLVKNRMRESERRDTPVLGRGAAHLVHDSHIFEALRKYLKRLDKSNWKKAYDAMANTSREGGVQQRVTQLVIDIDRKWVKKNGTGAHDTRVACYRPDPNEPAKIGVVSESLITVQLQLEILRSDLEREKEEIKGSSLTEAERQLCSQESTGHERQIHTKLCEHLELDNRNKWAFTEEYVLADSTGNPIADLEANIERITKLEDAMRKKVERAKELMKATDKMGGGELNSLSLEQAQVTPEHAQVTPQDASHVNAEGTAAHMMALVQQGYRDKRDKQNALDKRNNSPPTYTLSFHEWFATPGGQRWAAKQDCLYCKENGHIIHNCKTLRERNGRQRHQKGVQKGVQKSRQPKSAAAPATAPQLQPLSFSATPSRRCIALTPTLPLIPTPTPTPRSCCGSSSRSGAPTHRTRGTRT